MKLKVLICSIGGFLIWGAVGLHSPATAQNSWNPNVFGGRDFENGVRSTPNVFGGEDFSNGVRSTPNVFGGRDYSNGVSCTPNVFGGMNCR